MTELRDLLERAAGDIGPPVPFAAIRRRGQTLARRRRVAISVGVVTVAAVLTAVLPHSARSNLPPARHIPLPVRVGVLAPGPYVDPLLNPHLTFTAPSGTTWRASLVTESSLVLSDDADHATVALQHLTGVYPADRNPTSATASKPPTDLIVWLTHHRGLRLAGPAEVTTLAGEPAHRLQFTIRPDLNLPASQFGCSPAAQCLIIAQTDDNPVSLNRDATMAITVPDDTHFGLILIVAAPTANFQAIQGDATQLVDSIAPTR